LEHSLEEVRDKKNEVVKKTKIWRSCQA
jgi:hypothetical protein